MRALQRLDHLLARAVTAARVAYGPQASADPFRGIHISQDEVEQLLAREPGMPLLWTEGEEDCGSADGINDHPSRLAWLKEIFSLTAFDVDLILIALAPELDLRYERLYAYLQDDVTRKRPSVDLVLNLLCPSAEEKLERRAHFAPNAHLISHRILHLIKDAQQPQSPLLAYFLKLDDQIIHLLLEQDQIDPRLAPFCRMLEPHANLDELSVSTEIKRALPMLVRQARETRRPLRLYFHGPHGVGKRRTAEALAADISVKLLIVDLSRAVAGSIDIEQTLKLVFRSSCLLDALLYIDSVDVLHGDGQSLHYQHLLDALCEPSGISILAGASPWVPSGRTSIPVMSVSFSVPDFGQRRACWQENLAALGVALSDSDVDTLASRFRLTPPEISCAITTADNYARWRAAAEFSNDLSLPSHVQPMLKDFFAAAREQSTCGLMTLARKIEPRYSWDDLILTPDALAQLQEICDQATYRHVVYGQWGFDRKMSLGKNITVLFSGFSGTGKTMAAEVIATALELDLFKIDLSRVVSKYIGETEKSLDRIFSEAEGANGILFFDEADTLFGKRSQVRDSHDRYANLEIGYLLQKMEEYEGIAILATNMRTNIDEAFLRRLKFHIEFPFPEEVYRRLIWQRHFPDVAPRGEDVDFGFLARQFKIAGGNIRNIVLNASFLAAADGRVICMRHVVLATKREYQKLGKMCTEAEFGPYYHLVQER